MSTGPKTPGKAVYTAPASDEVWLRSVQRKLYTRSWKNPDYVFRELWGLVTDLRNLRCALSSVSRNRGSRTSGVDRVTVRMVLETGAQEFVEELRAQLRTGAYRPSPARRHLIPKAGKPGEFRPLGIPTVRDRVVQAAVKSVMEPIFEADFYPYSFGFRGGKSVHGALAQLRQLMGTHMGARSPREKPRPAYQWVIEGDIKGCFDNISHHGLMNRVRRRVTDGKLNRLVVAFLKAGVMADGQYRRTRTGTPQGGILSPLLANIALSVIDERYERHAWPRLKPKSQESAAKIKKRARSNRSYDKSCGKPVLVPIRYADDFLVLVSAPEGVDQWDRARALAMEEKACLSKMLKEELNLELSEVKTTVTPVTEPIRFLGFHFTVKRHPVWGWTAKVLIPRTKSKLMRAHIKAVFKRPTCNQSLSRRLDELNPVIRGWAYFYRHAKGAKRVDSDIDHYIWHAIHRWLKKKHPQTSWKRLAKRYARPSKGRRGYEWFDADVTPFKLASIRVASYRIAWESRPCFVETPMESPVHNERCTPGLGEGDPETAR